MTELNFLVGVKLLRNLISFKMLTPTLNRQIGEIQDSRLFDDLNVSRKSTTSGCVSLRGPINTYKSDPPRPGMRKEREASRKNALEED